jgi:hypothetical protein
MTTAHNAAARYDLNVTEEVPDFALLFLPPFPLPNKAVLPPVSFGLWKQPGISIVCFPHVQRDMPDHISPSETRMAM